MTGDVVICNLRLFIKMCYTATELQALWKPKVGDMFVRANDDRGDGYSDIGIVITHKAKIDAVWLPTSDQLYLLCCNDYKGKYGVVASKRGLIADINDWHGLNEWAWEWELRQILLGYWMRLQGKCWDAIEERWVCVNPSVTTGG